MTPAASQRSRAGGSARARKVLQPQPPRQQAAARQQGSPPWSAVLQRAQLSLRGLPRASREAVAAFARPSCDPVARRRRGCARPSSGPTVAADRARRPHQVGAALVDPLRAPAGVAGAPPRPPAGVAVRSETSARGRARGHRRPKGSAAAVHCRQQISKRGWQAVHCPQRCIVGSGALSAACSGLAAARAALASRTNSADGTTGRSPSAACASMAALTASSKTSCGTEAPSPPVAPRGCVRAGSAEAAASSPGDSAVSRCA